MEVFTAYPLPTRGRCYEFRQQPTASYINFKYFTISSYVPPWFEYSA